MLNRISAEVRFLWGYLKLRMAAEGDKSPSPEESEAEITKSMVDDYQDLLWREREFSYQYYRYLKNKISGLKRDINALTENPSDPRFKQIEDLKEDLQSDTLELQDRFDELVKKWKFNAEKLDKTDGSSEFQSNLWSDNDQIELNNLNRALKKRLSDIDFAKLSPKKLKAEPKKEKDEDKFSVGFSEQYDVRTKYLTGRAVIEIVNKHLPPEEQIPLTRGRAITVGHQALWAARDKKGGNISAEDVVNQRLEYLARSMAGGTDKYGKKLKKVNINPWETSKKVQKPGSKQRSKAEMALGAVYDFISSEAKTEAVKRTTADDVNKYAYYKYLLEQHEEDPKKNKGLNAKQKKEYEALVERMTGVYNLDEIPSSSVLVRKPRMETYDVFSRGDSEGEEVESGYSALPPSEEASDPESGLAIRDLEGVLGRVLNPQQDPETYYSYLLHLEENDQLTKDQSKDLARLEKELIAERGPEYVGSIQPQEQLVPKVRRLVYNVGRDDVEKELHKAFFEMVFDREKGDFVAGIDKNMNFKSNLIDLFKEKIQDQSNFEFLPEEKDLEAVYRFTKFQAKELRSELAKNWTKAKEDQLEALKEKIKKQEKNLKSYGYDDDTLRKNLPPSPVQPTKKNEFEELLEKGYIARAQGFNWQPVKTLIEAAKRLQGESGRKLVEKVRDNVLKTIRGSLTDEQKEAIEDLYYGGDKEYSTRIQKQNKQKRFDDQRRKDTDTLQRAVDSYMSGDSRDYNAALQTLIDSVDSLPVLDKHKQIIKNKASKLLKLEATDSDLNDLIYVLKTNSKSIPSELVEILSNPISRNYITALKGVITQLKDPEFDSSAISVPDRQKILDLADKVLKMNANNPEYKQLVKLFEKYKAVLPPGFGEILSEERENPIFDIVRTKTTMSLEDKYNLLLWHDSFRKLSPEERTTLEKLEKLFEERQLLPTGKPPEEGVDTQITDLRKCLRLSEDDLLHFYNLVEYDKYLADCLMTDYGFTEDIIDSFEPWDRALSRGEIKAMQDRAAAEGQLTEEERIIEKAPPRRRTKESKLYEQLRYLDKVGLAETELDNVKYKEFTVFLEQVLPHYLKKQKIDPDSLTYDSNAPRGAKVLPFLLETLEEYYPDTKRWLPAAPKPEADVEELEDSQKPDDSQSVQTASLKANRYYRYLKAINDRNAFIAASIACV